MSYVYMKVITKRTETSAISYIWKLDYFISVHLFIHFFFLIFYPGVLQFLTSYMNFLDMLIMCRESPAFSNLWQMNFFNCSIICICLLFIIIFLWTMSILSLICSVRVLQFRRSYMHSLYINGTFEPCILRWLYTFNWIIYL